MSGFLIVFNGPLHWTSKNQNITAKSSEEAETYATNECVREIVRLPLLSLELNILEAFIPEAEPVTLYSYNMACLYWYKLNTTKVLSNIRICEDAIIKSAHEKLIHVKHIQGETNISDIFTTKHKDTQHFLTITITFLKNHLLTMKFHSYEQNSELYY